MKTLKRLSFLAILLTFLSCQNDDRSNVVSQQYVHKYGFDMSKNEWQSRSKEGSVISVLDSGITVTNTYNNGVLHGESSYTFPNSSIIDKIYTYDNGTLIKETLHDKDGIPYKEATNEPDNKKVITLWDRTGVPISIEEYENNKLINAKYFKPNNELEASIENQSGIRMKRDREGELLYKDIVKNGKLKHRSTYHPNGQIKAKVGYKNYNLHGEQFNYSDKGDVILTMTWNKGQLNGMKTTYKNNNKMSEIPFSNGLKHGIERHFAQDGRLEAEIHWDNDKKHGSERIYHKYDTHINWFYKGKAVSLKKFEEFSFREKLIANKDTFYEMIENMDDLKAMKE